MPLHPSSTSRVLSSVGRFSAVHHWPVLAVHRGPCDSRAADILFNIISRRHEHRSTVISTNPAFKQWGTVFPGAACVVALVDRFAQHCHKVDIDADSWRDRHSFERDDSPEKPVTPPSRPAKKR
jgi:hypothetical protein